MIGSINLLDILLILIVSFSILFGILKGFIREIFSLAFFLIAVILAFLFYNDLGRFFLPHLKNQDVSNFAGFISIFVIVLIVGTLVTFFIKKVFSLGPLKTIDTIMGGVFGLLRGVLISTIIVFALIVFPINHRLVQNSQLSPFVLKTIDIFKTYLPAKYKDKIKLVQAS